jgi:branched-chain amino acid transport system ATP-binding protein
MQATVNTSAAGDSARETAGTTILGTSKLGKSFGGFQALKNVDLSVREGQILGIIGPNGAGKTTLFNLIAGALRPSSGRVTFQGSDITRLPPHRRLRKGIARTFQLIHPFASLSVHDNAMTAAMASGASRKVAQERAAQAVELLGLGKLAHKRAAGVNAVEGKRLEVARALATEPSVILLDEIFSGLNADEVDELVGVVNGIRDRGVTVLVIEHNVRAIRAVAEHVVAIVQGSVVSAGTPEQVFADPRVVESYLGHRHASA